MNNLNKKYKFVVFTSILAISIFFIFLLFKPSKTTLYFYAHNDDYTDTIIENYEKENPDINIEKILIPDHKNRFEFIQNTLDSKNKSVDIVDLDIIWLYSLAKSNKIISLDKHFSNSYLTNFLSSSIDGNIIDNNLYALPYRTDTGILYYRADLLNKYNQKVPTTYEELINTYKFISEHEDIYGFAGSWNNYEGLTCNALEMLWTFGGKINTSDSDTPIINTKNNKKAFLEIKKIMDNNITHPEILNFYSGQLRKEFINGNLLFMRDWPAGWDLIQNSPNSKVRDKVKITQLPIGNAKGINKGALGGWQLAVAEKSKNKSEAIDFIKYFINYQNNKNFIIKNTYIPTKKDLFYDSDVIKNIPFIKKNINIFNNSKHRPFFNRYNEFSLIFSTNFTSYLNNKMTIDEFLEKTEESLQKIKN